MTRRDWIKVILLVLIPLSTWLIVLYQQKTRWRKMWMKGESRNNALMSLKKEYIRKTRFKIQTGLRMPNAFPFPVKRIGNPVALGLGKPVLFLSISWIAEPEVWELAIDEALKSNPNLQVVLLYDYAIPEPEALKLATTMWHKWNNHRISILMSPSWYKVFGNTQDGILAVFCDERGIIRHIEPYPSLKVSPYWADEVADWRPKLHQAVKKVLDKFFPKR